MNLPRLKPMTVEEAVDLVISLGCMAVFWACLLVLPLAVFWFWFVPLAAFWLRFNFVMVQRERAADISDSRWVARQALRHRRGRSVPPIIASSRPGDRLP